MMLSTLKRRAQMATAFRGHRMKWLPPWHGEGQSLQNGECVKCGAFVQLNTRPMPNQIDIGGNALALTCPIGEED